MVFFRSVYLCLSVRLCLCMYVSLSHTPLNGFEFHIVDVIFTDGAEGNTVSQIHSQRVLLAFRMVLRGENREGIEQII